jgi:hypothetical protein
MLEIHDTKAGPPDWGLSSGLRTNDARRSITQEQLEHLPSELHKLVAQALIARGEWIVVEHENQTSGDCRMAMV